MVYREPDTWDVREREFKRIESAYTAAESRHEALVDEVATAKSTLLKMEKHQSSEMTASSKQRIDALEKALTAAADEYETSRKAFNAAVEDMKLRKGLRKKFNLD